MGGVNEFEVLASDGPDRCKGIAQLPSYMVVCDMAP